MSQSTFDGSLLCTMMVVQSARIAGLRGNSTPAGPFASKTRRPPGHEACPHCSQLAERAREIAPPPPAAAAPLAGPGSGQATKVYTVFCTSVYGDK